MADRTVPFSGGAAVTVLTTGSTIHTAPPAKVGQVRGSLVEMTFINNGGSQDFDLVNGGKTGTITLATKGHVTITVWVEGGSSVTASAGTSSDIEVFGFARDV